MRHTVNASLGDTVPGLDQPLAGSKPQVSFANTFPIVDESLAQPPCQERGAWSSLQLRTQYQSAEYKLVVCGRETKQSQCSWISRAWLGTKVGYEQQPLCSGPTAPIV
jgi:hypothetical protein